MLNKKFNGLIIAATSEKDRMSTNKNNKPTMEAMKDYNPKDRDFQRIEEDLDDVSKSEKDALKKKKENEKSNGQKQDK